MIKEFYYNSRASLVKIYLNALYPSILKRRAKAIGKKNKIEVVFFAMNVAMWHYQGVYDLLSKENRFNCHIVLTSPRQFSVEQRSINLKALRAFFDEKGIQYHDYDDETDTGYNVKDLIDPDILFYPQPYEIQYRKGHCFNDFKDKLLCYIPYSINVIKSDSWLFDTPFHNLAWKVYCPTKFELENAQKTARNHGRNWIVSGYENMDRYCNEKAVDVWKIKDDSKKRLIWAPHFTIESKPSMLGCRSNFLRMARLMLDIADSYLDKLQVAFKPHPWLKTMLYEHPEWGRAVTDEYFDRWANGINTQLETGDFVDLFMTSDAMIHDCGSFTAEYLCVNKPVAFVSNDFEDLMSRHNELGQLALKQHYLLKTEEDIISFIEDVVLGGKDIKATERKDFYDRILKPQVTGTTSQFIVDDIKRSLGIK